VNLSGCIMVLNSGPVGMNYGPNSGHVRKYYGPNSGPVWMYYGPK